MKNEEFIPVDKLCSHYEVQISFFNRLSEYGLVELTYVETETCVHVDSIAEIERVLRLQEELELNLEAVDTVFTLLERIKKLEDQLKDMRSRLGIYE